VFHFIGGARESYLRAIEDARGLKGKPIALCNMLVDQAHRLWSSLWDRVIKLESQRVYIGDVTLATPLEAKELELAYDTSTSQTRGSHY
jgi:hypothetical protein